MSKTISRNEFIPKVREELPSYTWETRTPVRCTFAEAVELYKADVKRGMFDKLSHDDTSDNEHMYYYVINSWLLLCCDCHAYGCADYLMSSIRKQGLLCTISECDNRADLVVQGLDPERAFPFFREAWSDDLVADMCRLLREKSSDYGVLSDDSTTACRLRLVLQLLRYPKRFSPKGLKGAREAVWRKFVTIQDRWKNISEYDVKDLQRWGDENEYPDRMIDTHSGVQSFYNQRYGIKHRHILNAVRDVVKEMIGEYRYGGYYEMVHQGDIKMSPGATADTCTCSFCKAYALETYTNYLGLSTLSDNKRIRVGGSTIRLIPVNKNYKTYRMIAPEEVLTQAVCYHECGKMYESFKRSKYGKMVDLDKEWHNGIKGQGQDRSRLLALIGSLNNSYDTLDWSSASDSISKHLSYYIATTEARKALNLFARRFVDDEGHTQKLYTTGTSGNSLTFLWESIVILAITIVALRLGGATEEEVNRIVVYGDDTIIPHGYAIIVKDIATLLGLELNPDKTCFHDTFYREACGGEYYRGVDISTMYFPRNLNISDTAKASVFNETPGRTTSIIALANRFSCEEGAFPTLGNSMHQFILSVIRDWFPDLRLGGDVIGPKSPFGVRSTMTSPKYSLLSVNSRTVTTDGIDIGDHASLSDARATVRMSIATSVTVSERQWYKLPKGARLTTYGYDGPTRWTDSGDYVPKYVPSEWNTFNVVWEEEYCTPVQMWDTPDDIRCRLINMVREAKTKANKALTKRILNTDMHPDIMMRAPRMIWNTVLKESSPYTVYNVGINANGYERRLEGFRRPHVTFTTERPYHITDDPTSNNSDGSWSVLVTRAKSQTVSRKPKVTCMCTRLSESERRSWWEMYSYYKFLAEGPEYEDELMRTLHVSRRRMTYDQAYGSSKTNLVNLYEPLNTYLPGSSGDRS